MFHETIDSKSKPLVPTTPSEHSTTVDLTTAEGENEDEEITTNSQAEDIQAIQEINPRHTNSKRNKITTRDIETFQPRLGYVPVKGLLLGSKAQIWRDTRFRLSPNGVFNTPCKISFMPKAKCLKYPFLWQRNLSKGYL